MDIEMNEARSALCFQVIENVYPTTELRDSDFNSSTFSLTSMLDERYNSKAVIEAAKTALAAIESEKAERARLAALPCGFTFGDKVVTTELQRGWPSAACAEPPVGTNGVVMGQGSVGMTSVRVHLRELGYECSDDDDSDDYKTFHFWTYSLEKVNG